MSSSKKLFIEGFINLLVRRYTGPFWIHRKWLNKTQWLSKEVLDSIQLNLLKKLISYSEKNVPFYRDLMYKNNITADDIHELSDIERFPILNKQLVLNAGTSMVSRRYPKILLRHAFTGGTTGTPMNIYRSPLSIGIEQAFVRRQWDWANVKLSDRCAYLTGRLIVKPSVQYEQLYFYNPFMKELILSSYHLNEINAKEYIEQIKRHKCVALVGYPSAIYSMAQAYRQSGQAGSNIKAVFTSSETLSDNARNTIQSVFGCQVYDFYGSAERVCYVFTCEKGNYHIQPEYGFTELIPVEQGSNICKVVSTGFWNYAMPFIRYELGDKVVKTDKTCECGRQFPCIERIDGRSGDVVRTVSGREFGTAILTHLLYGTNNIIESQIIQDSIDHIRIEYVPNSNFSRDDMLSFKNLINMHLPVKELKVDFVKVEKIERTVSGKLRPVISRVQN